MRGKNDFEPGDLVQHTIYERVGLVLQNVTSSVMSGYIQVHQRQWDADPSTHRYYKVLINGRADIYSPYYLKLLKKGKNNER